MGLSYTAERLIDAPPATVWAVLTDKQTLLEGSFGFISIDGPLELGGTLQVRTHVAPKQTFRLNVAAFESEHRMVWRGGMPFGLFTGTRVFSLEHEGSMRTRFAVHESFSGLLAGLIRKSMPDLQPSFDQFADSLKSASEQRAP